MTKDFTNHLYTIHESFLKDKLNYLSKNKYNIGSKIAGGLASLNAYNAYKKYKKDKPMAGHLLRAGGFGLLSAKLKSLHNKSLPKPPVVKEPEHYKYRILKY